MKNSILAGLGAIGVGVVLAFAPAALAHSNGHESRTPADCEKLPGTAEKGERGLCLRCVTKGGTHYHPDYPLGKRCRPDDGKP